MPALLALTLTGCDFFSHVPISPQSNLPTYLTTVTDICIRSSQTIGITSHMHTHPHGGVTANPSLSRPTHKDFIFIDMVFFHSLHYTSLFYFISTVHSDCHIPLQKHTILHNSIIDTQLACQVEKSLHPPFCGPLRIIWLRLNLLSEMLSWK